MFFVLSENKICVMNAECSLELQERPNTSFLFEETMVKSYSSGESSQCSGRHQFSGNKQLQYLPSNRQWFRFALLFL